MAGSVNTNRIHPLVAGAAVSVMLVSLTGVAAITGILPKSHSEAADVPPAAASAEPTPAIAAAPAALTPPKAETPAAAEPKTKPAPVAKQEPRPQPARQAQAPVKTYTPPPVAKAPATCYSCGRVESVRTVQVEGQPSGLGMIAGAVVGGALGNQVGGGNGKKLATVAGAIGGGYAGTQIERNARSTTTYEVRVRMEGGEVRTFPYAQQPSWGPGDSVRVVDGQLTSRG